MRPGLWQLVIVAVLVIVIFGGKRLPELGKGLGQAWTNFRQALRPGQPPKEGDTLTQLKEDIELFAKPDIRNILATPDQAPKKGDVLAAVESLTPPKSDQALV